MMVVSLLKVSVHTSRIDLQSESTHKWQSTVRAHVDLRLIHIDEDLRMPQWSSPTVARHNPLVRPADRLLMDQINSGIGSRLSQNHISLSPLRAKFHLIAL